MNKLCVFLPLLFQTFHINKSLRPREVKLFKTLTNSQITIILFLFLQFSVNIWQSHPAIGPVEFLEHRLEVLHGSVSDQHDGLVTHAALAVHPRLQTHAEGLFHTAAATTPTCFCLGCEVMFSRRVDLWPHWGFWRTPSWRSWSSLLL